jgi:hypothetical protein
MKLRLKALACAFALVVTTHHVAAEDFTVTGVTFTKPDSWKKVAPSSSMRKAQLEIGQGADQANVVFFHFGPGGAGGVDANVNRWLGQFKESKEKLNSKTESKKVGDSTLTFVRAEGTFMDGAPFGPKSPKAGYMLFAAIIEAGQGPIFVKMTGPKKTVSAAAKDMRKMVEDAAR